MTAAVEHDVLPDLVADGHRVEALAEAGEQGQVLVTLGISLGGPVLPLA
ncbi:MAG: hypothetical protein JHC71_19555 [Blastococcus sp.]|nr:hypothetical protein [Blastococcus sp.]